MSSNSSLFRVLSPSRVQTKTEENSLPTRSNVYPKSFTDIMVFCLVQGDAIKNSFPIDTSNHVTFGHLKKAIKDAKQNTFNSIDADNLTLWKADIIQTKENQEVIVKEHESTEFHSFEFVRQYFQDTPISTNIRVIVQIPPPAPATTAVQLGKRKADDEIDNKKMKIDLTPESIVKFLTEDEENKKWLKANFTKPFKLCDNEFKFERKGREDALNQTYDYIFERHRRIIKAQSLYDKNLHPLIALQSAPGGGKSFFFDELASLKRDDLKRYLDGKNECKERSEFVDMLSSSVAICITYNGGSTYDCYDLDKDIRRGLVMRLIWSYFFDEKKLSWDCFRIKFRDIFGSLDTFIAVQSIIEHSKRSILLCVDEIMKVSSGDHTNFENITKLLDQLNKPYENLAHTNKKFHYVVSTLDAINVWRAFTNSQRPIKWIPIRRLIPSESAELFHEIIKGLDRRRLFVIKKCIIDCNGHPRTLERFYQLISGDNIALNSDGYSSLIERLSKLLVQLTGGLSFSAVKIALLGNKTSLYTEVKTDLGKLTTVKELISTGIYINSLTKKQEISSVIPILSPVALQCFSMDNKDNAKDDDAKDAAMILRKLFATESSFDDEVMDGKPFERFHANWELLYRVLHNGEVLSLCNIYGLSGKSEWPKIEIHKKLGIIELENLEFPPSGKICNTKGNSIENFVDYILVPTKSNNSGFDIIIFEKKADGTGYIAINIECKYSYPSSETILTSNDIKMKYESTKEKYFNHVKYQYKRLRSDPIVWKEGQYYNKSAVGKLNMAMDDVYLICVAWRDIATLSMEITGNENLFVVGINELEKIYTPSLAMRPDFYYDELQKNKNIKI